MADIDARLARLEAAEAVRGAFARYTHFLDGGFVDDLLGVFAADAELVAENYPPGTGGTVRCRGRGEIDGFYRPLTFGAFRHHSTNTTLDVASTADRAELSSYFLTAFPEGIQGGVYEGTFEREGDGRWRIARWQITSAWGWRGGPKGFRYSEPLAARTLRGGAPVVWDETL